MSEQIALVVGISELLCAEHIEVLGTKTWIEREENLLGNVHRIVVGDGIGELHVIALRSGNGASRDLLACDGIEAIEQVKSSVTVGIALTSPDSLIQMLRERLGNKRQHMLCRRRLHLSIALRVTNLTEECRYSAVRGSNFATTLPKNVSRVRKSMFRLKSVEREGLYGPN